MEEMHRQRDQRFHQIKEPVIMLENLKERLSREFHVGTNNNNKKVKNKYFF